MRELSRQRATDNCVIRRTKEPATSADAAAHTSRIRSQRSERSSQTPSAVTAKGTNSRCSARNRQRRSTRTSTLPVIRAFGSESRRAGRARFGEMRRRKRVDNGDVNVGSSAAMFSATSPGLACEESSWARASRATWKARGSATGGLGECGNQRIVPGWRRASAACLQPRRCVPVGPRARTGCSLRDLVPQGDRAASR